MANLELSPKTRITPDINRKPARQLLATAELVRLMRGHKHYSLYLQTVAVITCAQAIDTSPQHPKPKTLPHFRRAAERTNGSESKILQSIRLGRSPTSGSLGFSVCLGFSVEGTGRVLAVNTNTYQVYLEDRLLICDCVLCQCLFAHLELFLVCCRQFLYIYLGHCWIWFVTVGLYNEAQCRL